MVLSQKPFPSVWQRFGVLLVCALALPWMAHATHNRAGEITYTHLQGLTYEVVITTYTKADALADRPFLKLRWGDEIGPALDSLTRELPLAQLPGNVQVNVYRGTHTYGGPGAYELSVEDPNRNDGVLNMTGSVDTPFAIRSLLIIDPQAGNNNSVQLLNPATENACLNQLWIHNPAAFDPDGDLLTFGLVPSRGFNGEFIPTYVYPDEVGSVPNAFEIDEFTGDVTWDSPKIAGEYNVAIRIEEWREVAGELRKVGEVVRDIQIDVSLCANQPPVLVALADTCVLAGETLSVPVLASDPDGQSVSLSAAGGPLTEVAHPATFVNLGGGEGVFTWTPQCAEVRAQPYQTVFKAQDLGNSVPLVDLASQFITVVSPPVLSLMAEPMGYSMMLTWTPHECVDNAGSLDPSMGAYDVYRRLQLEETDWTPQLCETGVPEGVGYQWAGSTEGLDAVGFLDEDDLDFGVTYCYRVVTRYGDGALSLASDETCGRIRKDVPVMTRASVLGTGTMDSVLVGWSPPTELDVLAFGGPYRYELMGRPMDGQEEGWSPLWLSPAESDLLALDTLVNVPNLDTEALAWAFQILLYSGSDLVGVPPPASTPRLTLVPDDNRLALQIAQEAPWRVESYIIERQVPTGGAYTVLDTVSLPLFVDSGLVNGQTYCYRVTTVGGYDDPTTESPLQNLSQEACGQPFDFTPPCAMELDVVASCAVERDTLSWTASLGCTSDDIMAYRIYWAPFLGDSLTLWQELEATEDPFAVFNEDDSLGTIAGCFVVTALDSLMPGPGGSLRRNESIPSDTVCVDNCPFYFLPNIFSPNGDDRNDTFDAFPWKFIDSVEVTIHNRWGELVFETNNPDIQWDGTYLDTAERMPDGVYMCAVTAYTRRLEGIVPERFVQELHLVDGRGSFID